MTEAPAVTPAAPPPAAPPATPPAPPAAPLSPAEAASKLAELRSNAEWGERLLRNDPSTVAEMRSLSRLVSEGNDLDALIVAGQDTADTSVAGALSARKVAGEIASLREHLTDDVIRELLNGRVSSPQEVAAVKKFQVMRHSDKGWVDRFMAGEHEAVERIETMLDRFDAGPDLSAEPKYLVPVFDVGSLQCDVIAINADSEAAAVWKALRNAPSLRFTGGAIERVEVNPEMSVAWDPWAERYQPARLREKA